MRHLNFKKSIFVLFGVLVALLCFSPIFQTNFTYAETSQTTSVSSSSLPNTFSLYNFKNYVGDNAGLTPNVGNQQSTNICWAFASNTALESTLYKSGLVDLSTTLNFSEVDIAYYAYNSRSYNFVGGGGFVIAYEYYSSENGPANEQSWEKSSLDWSSDSKLFSSYQTALKTYGTDLSKYATLESYKFPSRSKIKSTDETNGVSSSETEEKIANLRNSIKQHIYTTGAVTSSIYAKYSNFGNSIFSNYSGSEPANHLVALVGWDDTFNNGKGAYIAQNSYGTATKWGSGYDCSYNGGYFYIMYEDVNVEDNVNGFVRVDEKVQNKNNYSSTRGSSYEDKLVEFTNEVKDSDGNVTSVKTITTNFCPLSQTFYFANVFSTTSTDQIVRQIKIPTIVVGNDSSTFEISIATLTESEYANLSSSFSKKFATATKIKNKKDETYEFTTQQTGYYTIDVQDEIVLAKSSSPYFIVYITQFDGVAPGIANNEDGKISDLTYYTSSPQATWQEYNSGKTVLPIIVSTVAKEKIQYTIENTSVTYNGNAQLPTINVSTKGVTIQYSLDNVNFYDTLDIKDVKLVDGNVSSYTIYIKIFGNIYETVNTSCSFTINPKILTITPYENSKIYGENDPVLTYLVSGYIEEDYVRQGQLTRDPGQNVGTYKILQGTVDIVGTSNSQFKKTNYTIQFVENVLFTINKRVLKVVPLNLIKIYGEDDPVVYTFEFQNTLIGETPSSNIFLSRASGNDVGSYNFSLSGELQDNGNFIATNYSYQLDTSKTFDITPRTLVITPDAGQKKIYGEGDPTLNFTYSNNVDGETPSFSGALSRTNGEDAGEYNILVGLLSLQDNGTFKKDNYTISFTSGVKFFISNGTIDVTLQDKTVTYSGEYQTLNYTSSIANLTVQYSLDNANYSSTNLQYKDCGEYTIYIKFSKENYDDTTKFATLKITPKTLTITPKNSTNTATYGDTLSSSNIAITIDGLANNEQASFTGWLGVADKNVGTHLITIGDIALQDNGTFKASNYNLTFSNPSNSTLTIEKRTITIEPISTSKIYGTSDPTFDFNIENSVDNDLKSCFTGSLTRSNLETSNVGTYNILQGTLQLNTTLQASKNYTLNFDSSKTFEIQKAPLTIKFNEVNCYYGNVVKLSTLDSSNSDNRKFTIISGTLYSDDLDLDVYCLDENNNQVEIDNTTRRSTANDGGYSLCATYNNANYDVTIESGRYIINYQVYTITFSVGSALSSIEREHFSTVGELPQGLSIEAPQGYILSGWTMNGGELLSTEDMLTREITTTTTFTAQFKPIEYIVYYVDSGEQKQLTTYTIESSINLNDTTILSQIQKTGYNFIGFYQDFEFSGDKIEQIAVGNMGDKTFYAKFEKKTFSVAVKSLEISSSATISCESTIKYGEDYVFSVTLDDRYNRSYNNLQAVISYDDTSLGQVNATKTLVDGSAQFVVQNVLDSFSIDLTGIELNKYTISFVADGKVVETFTKDDGESLLLSEYQNLDIPTKEHYDLSQWDKQEDIVDIHDDLVVNAIYTPNTYTVTFLLDGAEYDVDVTYGTSVDTSILSENHELGTFEYFKYDKSIDNISQDEIISVSVGSNAYILYIILGIVGVAIVGVIILNVIRQHRRKKFAWWVFGK